MNAPLSEAEAHARASVKENRVYVGNLPYNCTYMDLKNALKEGGWILWISHSGWRGARGRRIGGGRGQGGGEALVV